MGVGEMIVVWALFDSGNGNYKQVADKINEIEGKSIDLYAIGIDRENKNSHFINLNLADYSYIFGNNAMYDTLDELPKPDLIIASPPCESWSNASGMANGNACWKQDEMENLFGTMKGSRFSVREYKDYENYQYYPERQLLTRINGELCIYNTVEIIKKYKPKYWVIENPAYGRIWEYIDKVLGWKIPCKNLTYYSDYGFEIMKPTRFSSNINFDLKKDKTKTEKTMNDVGGYNKRSDIPHEIIEVIYKTILKLEETE